MNRLLAIVTALVTGVLLVGAPIAGHTHDTARAGLFSAECPLSELAHQGPVLPQVELSLVRFERPVEPARDRAVGQIFSVAYSFVPSRAPPAS
jgi:hypothetical protein